MAKRHCRACFHRDAVKCVAKQFGAPLETIMASDICDCRCHLEQDDELDAEDFDEPDDFDT